MRRHDVLSNQAPSSAQARCESFCADSVHRHDDHPGGVSARAYGGSGHSAEHQEYFDSAVHCPTASRAPPWSSWSPRTRCTWTAYWSARCNDVVANQGPFFAPLKAALMAQNDRSFARRAANRDRQTRSHHHGRQEHALQRAEENHDDMQRSRVRQGVLCRGRTRKGGDLNGRRKSGQRVPTGLAPYYRRYELPWSPSEEMERRFRTILRNLGIVFAIVAIVLPFPAAAPSA